MMRMMISLYKEKSPYFFLLVNFREFFSLFLPFFLSFFISFFFFLPQLRYFSFQHCPFESKYCPKYEEDVWVWVVRVLWHINLCRLLNSKSIFMKIVQLQTIKFSISTQFKCKYSLIVKNISISSYLV